MIAFLSPLANTYSEQFTSEENPLRAKVLEETLANHPKAHMVSGSVQGMFLELLSKIIRPKRILEIGTFTGYSALCLAEGLPQDGLLHTIELRDEDALKASEYFQASPLNQQIKLHRGNALDIIPTLGEQWDLVFLDADKTGYAAYYDLVIDNMAPGAILLADNVLFHGDVLAENIKGKNGLAVHEFNKKIREDSRVDQVLLTIRDGLLMIRKK